MTLMTIDPMLAEFVPQPGPQMAIMQCSADIAFFGGQAGGGKSFAMLLEPLRHASRGDFGAVIFRRTYPEITNEGGLWDEARKIYPKAGGVPNETGLFYRFDSGMTVSFSHIQHESDVHAYQGSQIPLIEFDELTTFTEYQFFYLMSRNRSTTGIPGYMRGTCNPDADSWVAKVIKWWIDQDTGYAIPERSGVIRWFVRQDREMHWFENRADAIKLSKELLPQSKFPTKDLWRQAYRGMPKSFTFIPSKLTDNRILMHKDPGYLGNLMAQDLVERERLLGGNWKIKPAAGLMFPRDKWHFIDLHECPWLDGAGVQFIRYWDKAGTEGGTGARTAGVLLAQCMGRFYVVDVVVGRWADFEREAMIRKTAEDDVDKYGRYGSIWVGTEQEPGSGGLDSANATVRNLAGFEVFKEKATGEKAERWRPFACQVQAGNCWIVRGVWNWADFILELDSLAGDKKLDESKLKDCADAVAAAFNRMVKVGWSYKIARDAAPQLGLDVTKPDTKVMLAETGSRKTTAIAGMDVELEDD